MNSQPGTACKNEMFFKINTWGAQKLNASQSKATKKGRLNQCWFVMNFQTQSSRDCLDLPGASRKVQRTEEIGQNLFWHHSFDNYTKNKIQKKGQTTPIFSLQTSKAGDKHLGGFSRIWRWRKKVGPKTNSSTKENNLVVFHITSMVSLSQDAPAPMRIN